MQIRNKKIRVAMNSIFGLFGSNWIFFSPIPEDNRILFFSRDRKDFGFLSNFYSCPIVIDNFEWPHVEAYYQSQKSTNPANKTEIKLRKSPA